MKKGVDHIGVCIVFYCHDGKGKVLLNRRTKYTRDEHGKWDPGGGGVNFGEPILKALKREIKEEYGADALREEFLGVRDIHRIDEKNRKTHWIALDYKVFVDPKEVKNVDPKTHDMVAWFSLKNLPSPLHSQFSDFTKKYKRRLQ